MPRRKWRGTADFNVPAGVTEGLMTICPGQQQQQGSRFRAIMETAAAKLDRLYIVDASALSAHNFKRLLPRDIAMEGAKRLADLRSENWRAMNLPAIEDTMGARAALIPMAEFAGDASFDDRVAVIREICTRPGNAASDYFAEGVRIDLAARGPRLRGAGLWLADEVIRESDLDYLASEYAMRSLMWRRWKLPEFYLGRAAGDPEMFQRENDVRPDLDLRFPPLHPITLQEVTPVHDRRLGRPRNAAPGADNG